MRARNWRERQDQGHKSRAGGDGIGEERKSRVTARQSFGHDSGTNHCRYEKGSAFEFGGEPP